MIISRQVAVIGLVVAGLAGPLSVRAQIPGMAAVGDKVRIETRDHDLHEGVVVAFGSDSVFVWNVGTTAFAHAEIAGLWVSRVHRATVPGLVLGMLAGAGAGAAVGSTLEVSRVVLELGTLCMCQGCCEEPKGKAVGAGALIGALVGACGGAIIGSSITHYTWAAAGLPVAVTVSAISPERAAVGVRLTL